VDAAARSARRAGKGPELLAFYEKQVQRSPRDVRWAVAVRDIKKAYHDVEGALAAAKAAVAVRPEQELLWREAVDLFVRADRPAEAAEFLEGWNKPRLADEGVARWRSQLYAQAGDGTKALAIEQAALASFARGSESQEDLGNRQARASERLLDLGFPDLALRLLSARNDARDLRGSSLAVDRQAQIALLTNQFPRFLASSRNAEERSDLARALARYGRGDQREEVLNQLLRSIWPVNGKPSDAALTAWWPFAQGAGLEQPLRMALAQRLLSGRPGPWQAAPPVAYVQSVSESVVADKNLGDRRWWEFRTPDVEGLWARDLARRDRGEEMLAFLEPHWQSLLREVRGTAPGPGRTLSAETVREPWSLWLDDPRVLAMWARAMAPHPEKVKELADVMSNRDLWDRFWVLAARHWKPEPLLAALPQDARLAWFRFWEPALQAKDPVLVARYRQVEQVTTALGRLVQGAPDAVKDPLIAKLRGPQTVGEVLGQDSRWVWPEFAPRRDARGELQEAGDDRVSGQGVDSGRVPGALWGDRPGEAWYVLEALARHRQGDPTAPYLPLDAPQRGGESSRALLAMRMAQTEKNLPLALEILARQPGGAHDRAWLEGKVTLLVAANQREQAVQAFSAYLLAAQAKLTEEEFRGLSALAEDTGLPAPLDLLDAQRPVGPAFLAYLRDLRPAEAVRFSTADPSGYRAALAQRWREREPQLSAEQIRYWLKELWAQDSASLPRRGLAKLGGPWPHAAAWLERQPLSDRGAALQTLEEALKPASANPDLFVHLGHTGSDDVADLLAVRVRLARGESGPALALAEGMLAGLQRGEALSFEVPELPGETSANGDEGEEAAPARRDGTGDPLVDRLRAWLKPFRDAKAAAPLEARVRTFLKVKRQEGITALPAWQLAFELSPPAEAPSLGQELDEAWFRGEVQPAELGPLTETLATSLPAEAPRWLARWPRGHTYGATVQRVAILLALKRPVEGARALFEARRRCAWEAREEVQAFDAWRRMGAPATPEAKAPPAWAEALPAWAGKAEAVAGPLGLRLKAHPLDVLSARAALRSPAAADEDALLRVGLALGAGSHGGEGDHLLLHLRAARGWLPRSAEAARWALGDASAEGIARLLVQRRFRTADINGALTDAARIARRVGDDGGVKEALRLLADRNAPIVKALRAEVAPPEAPPSVYRTVEGRPVPIRPRDLTWALLSSVIKTEGVR
jgi:hypothetical protein